MFKTSLVLALAVLGLCAAIPIEDNAKWDWRIVGGENAQEEEFPYQVSLRSSLNSHFCGGTILNRRTILTAAHCVDRRALANCVIHAGTHLLTQRGTVYQSQRITMHPSYNSALITYDVAVVITTTDIEFNEAIQPLKLAEEYTDGGEIVILSGWGTTTYPGSLPTNLQYISLKTLDYDDCRSKLASVHPVFENQICTFTKIGEGACHGDSGGPLVLDDELVGVVSWGSPCARGYPDVFSRVTAFKDWIEANWQE